MAVSYLGVVGSGITSGTSLVIPVGINVPRSDPTGGATLVFITGQYYNNAGVASQATDSAATYGFYGFRFYEDGLNHYAAQGIGVGGTWGTTTTAIGLVGIILNPLVSGVDTITVTVPGVSGIAATAFAFTGCNCDVTGIITNTIGGVVFPAGFTTPANAASPYATVEKIIGGVPSDSNAFFGTSGGTPGSPVAGPVSAPGVSSWSFLNGEYLIASYALGTQAVAGYPPATGWAYWDDPYTTFSGQFDIFGDNAAYVLGMQAYSGSFPYSPALTGSWVMGGFPEQDNATGVATGLIAGPGPSPASGALTNPVFGNTVKISPAE